MTISNVNDDSVAGYLKNNHDFFERNNQLLEELHLTHQTNGAVSLIERQVTLLRDANRQHKKQLKELVDIAKENDRLNEAMHQLTLGVLKAKSIDDILNTTALQLREQFNSEYISIQLVSEGFPNVATNDTTSHISRESTELSSINNVLKRGKPICGKLTAEQLQACFKELSKETLSAALIPLNKPHSKDLQGFIAIGSKDAKRFQISMGTIFLEHMGEIIGHALSRKL